MNMTNSVLRSTVTKILRQEGVSKISFKLGGLLVSGEQLVQVANAIDAGRISCLTTAQFESQGKDELAHGMTVAARYQIKKNAMVLESEGYGNALGEDRTILHEAVHAMFDLHLPAGTKNLSRDDEAAAVMAEAFYIRLCGKPVGGFAMMIDGPQREALRLVDEIRVATNDFNSMPSPYVFPDRDIVTFRTAVSNNWNFKVFKDSDGRWTNNSKMKYTYDGVAKCK